MTGWQQDGEIFEDAGDVGGDDQAGNAASVRFTRPAIDGEFPMVTVYAYPYVDSNAPGGAKTNLIGLQVQTEYLLCTDPTDPGGTEVWSDYRYRTVRPEGSFSGIKEAEAAALEYVRNFTADRVSWSGERFSEYPEHDVMSAAQPKTQAAHDFLEHAEEYGVTLCGRPVDDHHTAPSATSFSNVLERWTQQEPETMADVSAFLDWAQRTHGVHLDREHHGRRVEPVYGRRSDLLLAEWVGVDLDELEREKQAMIRRLRAANSH